MTDFNWCHGPSCHKQHTVDRVRGVKGSKVLRTRKVKTYNGNQGFYNWFCSQSCERDFCNKYTQQIIAIAPRTEALETPIENPTKERSEYGWVNWNRDSFYSKFCSNSCYNEFANKYVNEITAIAPRTECQETPINVTKETTDNPYWGRRVETKIEVDESRQID